jgi:hypothetical protein
MAIRELVHFRGGWYLSNRNNSSCTCDAPGCSGAHGERCHQEDEQRSPARLYRLARPRKVFLRDNQPYERPVRDTMPSSSVIVQIYNIHQNDKASSQKKNGLPSHLRPIAPCPCLSVADMARRI